MEQVDREVSESTVAPHVEAYWSAAVQKHKDGPSEKIREALYLEQFMLYPTKKRSFYSQHLSALGKLPELTPPARR